MNQTYPNYVIISIGVDIMEEKVICQKLDHFGRGIVYLNGKITFVSNLLPKEEAYIKVIKSKKNQAEAKITKIIKESPDRIKPQCPYLNCGCALKHLKYEKQLEYKEEKVKDILKRFAHIEPPINSIIPSSSINNYRNKITLKVDTYVGYHQNHSNNIIAINKCELASGKTNEIIKILNTLNLNNVKEITIKDFGEVMLIADGNFDFKSLIKLVSSIYINEKLVYGKPYLITKINDLNFQISKNSFFQVNKQTMEKLYELAIKYCGKDQNKKVLDLYCGTGTITLLLSKCFKEVLGVEINEEAIKCAEENKKLNNIKNVKFICGDVTKEINKLKKWGAEIIVVDPPRSGLSKEGISDILNINPETIVYISCDPVTLARDLNILKDKYIIEEVTPVDMFPNTYHVECVTKLKKR